MKWTSPCVAPKTGRAEEGIAAGYTIQIVLAKEKTRQSNQRSIDDMTHGRTKNQYRGMINKQMTNLINKDQNASPRAWDNYAGFPSNNLQIRTTSKTWYCRASARYCSRVQGGLLRKVSATRECARTGQGAGGPGFVGYVRLVVAAGAPGQSQHTRLRRAHAFLRGGGV